MDQLMWLRELDVRIGPIVGFTDCTSTRIWAAAAEDDDLVLRYAIATEEPEFDGRSRAFALVAVGEVVEVPFPVHGDFRTGQLVLTGLEPGRAYFYEIVRRGRKVGDHGFAQAQPFRFRTAPKPDSKEIGFVFMSCNGLSEPPRGRSPTAMWERLGRVSLADPSIRFAVLGGDQVYADMIRKRWLAENDPDDALDEPAQARLRGQLQTEYARVYAGWWKRPEIRAVLAQLPCVMTWDDHDIYDGWGSHGDEAMPAQRAFFEAAAAAFDAHQLVHAPRVQTGADIRHHRAFAFRVESVGFIVLDLRTCRSVNRRGKSALLGDDQWSFLKAKLVELGDQGVRQLVVVTSVPPVFACSALSKLAIVAGPLRDDLTDQWSSPENREDQLRLFGTLFSWRAAGQREVLILGGDVHLAAVGGVRTKVARFLRPGENEARLHQGISSGIAHKSVSGFGSGLVEKLVESEHVFSSDFVGFVSEAIAARNFAVVRAMPDDREFDFALHLEDDERPRHHRFM